MEFIGFEKTFNLYYISCERNTRYLYNFFLKKNLPEFSVDRSAGLTDVVGAIAFLATMSARSLLRKTRCFSEIALSGTISLALSTVVLDGWIPKFWVSASSTASIAGAQLP